MKKKVLLGMSGGVDSSVAALLLLEQGYDVIGVTMKLRPDNLPQGPTGSCGSLDDTQDARQVADWLGIPHLVWDFSDRFCQKVVDYFVAEYLCGRTPNPCVACNRYLKFDAMLERALEEGCDYIATGHYARIEKSPDGRWLLKRAPNQKDQSYVLYHLTQFQLAHTLFPLGGLDKSQARALAQQRGLPVAFKPDSQEICFIPNKDYAGFITRYTKNASQPGNFVDQAGRVLGQHRGIIHYTIGQRKGLGCSFGKPMYVVRICPQNNTVVLGEEGSQYASSLTAQRLNWIPFSTLEQPLQVTAKVRYQATAAAATIYPLSNDQVQVEFEQPQRSVTPGQAVVFYNGDTVIGGGTIVSPGASA